MANPARTETYPVDQRGYQTGPDPITALGVVGTGLALPMLAAQESFLFGRGEGCDLRVDRKYLATVHARIERIASSQSIVRVTNVSNGKNDIVHNGEFATKEFVMSAGEWFEVGDSRYCALNEEMRLARPTVMEILGLRQHRAIDELLISAVKDSTRPIMLLGESGSEQTRLARIIHQISHRRHNQFLVLDRSTLDGETRQALRDACNGVVLVPLYQRGKLDHRVVAALVNPDAKLRLILCARSRDKVESSFPIELVSDAKQITIHPLRERNSEIPELLDRWFIACRSSIRFAALREELRQGLMAYAWPDNLQELRDAADHIIELAHYRSAHQATEGSALSRGELRSWFRRLNLTNLKFPLVPERAD